MNLQEFISGTLKRILGGVADVQKSFADRGGKVNPAITGNQKEFAPLGLLYSYDDKTVLIVEFDVALTVTEGKETRSDIGVVAGVVALGSRGESCQENQSLNRVEFKIPISLPQSHEDVN